MPAKKPTGVSRWIIIPTIILTVLIVYAMNLECPNENLINGNTYVGSATLMGLAVFGSILGMKFGGGTWSHRRVRFFVIMMLLGAIVVIVVQLKIMMCVHGGELLNTMNIMMVITATALIVVMFGFAGIVNDQIDANEVSKDPSNID